MATAEATLESGNLTERLLVCGYPKTGRTWLRFMMANALSEEFNLDLDIDLNNVYSVVPNENSGTIDGQPEFSFSGVVPKIEMSHRSYQPEFEAARLIFTTRDPRDIMVSHWLHDTLQVSQFDGSLSEYVRDEKHGIDNFLDHLESWVPHIEPQQLTSYEDMRRDPHIVLSWVFGRLHVDVSDASIEHGVALGDINRMRKIEIDSGLAGHSYNRANPEARRVRTGKIGGFRHYLGSNDLSYIQDAIGSASDLAQSVIATTPYPVA